MVTLLGSLIGFISAAFPDLLKIWRDAADRKHELTILEMQMAQAAQGHQQRLEEINTQADIAESRALYKTYYSGIKWVDALNGTVRPVLAYSFFFLYFISSFLIFHFLYLLLMIQSCISAFQFHEIFMCPLFNKCPLIHDQNQISCF